VLGQEYPLYTDVPEEDIEEILNLVKMQIESQSKSSKSILRGTLSGINKK
jgi:cell division protein ZapA